MQSPPAPELPLSVQGQPLASLWEEFYAQLRVIARKRLRRDGPFTLLDTTGLVTQSYLKLLEGGRREVEAVTPLQFFSFASRVMRSVVVDLARERLSERKGGGAEALRLSTRVLEQEVAPESDPLYVETALEALRQRDPRLASVVEMRFFGGFSEGEIAELLGVTERTVRRDWIKARTLMRMLLA